MSPARIKIIAKKLAAASNDPPTHDTGIDQPFKPDRRFESARLAHAR
jgi:hypothetical protein